MVISSQCAKVFVRRLTGMALALLLAASTGWSPDSTAPGDEAAARQAAPKQVPPMAAADSMSSGENPATAAGSLTWTGCDISRRAYMSEAAKAYREATGVEILVTGGGATRGIRATVGGQTDLGGACRHCLPDEFPEDEGGAFLTHVGWDALVFFTHESNPVEGLTMEQARGILLGEITNWSELGGEDARILPVFRRQTVEGKLSGVGYMTRLLVFGDPTIDYTSHAVFLRSSGPIEQFVEGTPDTFAVTGVSSARKRLVRILALDGVYPDNEAISEGRYPLFRPLYLVTRGKPTGLAADFVDWLTGPAGQAVLSKAETVNLAEGAVLSERFEHWPRDD
jgi:phosphate transport system substrate-binding protein